jgi:hypothetical protein
VLLSALCSCVVGSRAWAQDGPAAAPELDEPRYTEMPDTTPDSRDRAEPFPLGVCVAAAGAVQNTALATSLGLRYRLSDLWLVGLDAEYNPFVVLRTGEIRPGVGNAYATVIKRWPMKFERANLRTSLHVGASRMMFDLYGAPEGSIGPYFGFNLLGVDIELSRSLYLVVDPADIAIPIPQTSGVPFVYPQYRFTLGIQLGA